VHPALKSASGRRPSETSSRSVEARLEEAVGLARAINLDVISAEIARIARPRADSLLGGGTLENLGGLISEKEIGLVVVDSVLSPVQQRNLERRWQAKVIDRTGLFWKFLVLGRVPMRAVYRWSWLRSHINARGSSVRGLISSVSAAVLAFSAGPGRASWKLIVV
jgi:hypothetical protein